MDNIDLLKSLLSTNQCDRLAKEKAAQDRIDDPKLPRHTVYQGDRKIQQLGQDTIENGLIINNQSLAIGDVMLPLAKGNVLRRVDNTNGGALLGTAYRDALENDFDANGNRRSAPLSRNGGNEPSDPNNPNKPRKPSDRVPPPFGCVPPPSQCFWSSNPIAPDGFQNHGDAVVNENAQPTYLHCKAGSSVPPDLGCDFLRRSVIRCDLYLQGLATSNCISFDSPLDFKIGEINNDDPLPSVVIRVTQPLCLNSNVVEVLASGYFGGFYDTVTGWSDTPTVYKTNCREVFL